MPTGYTAPIYEGKPITFEEFTWRCARAFGAFVMMRDEPMGAPIPTRFEPSDWHAKRQAETEADLADLNRLTASQLQERADADYRERMAAHLKYRREREDLADRYRAMIARVEAWDVPAENAGLKEFMLKQLQESLEFDCGHLLPQPSRLDGTAWYHERVAQLTHSIGYCAEQQAAEVARTDDRNRWIDSLRDSIGDPPRSVEVAR